MTPKNKNKSKNKGKGKGKGIPETEARGEESTEAPGAETGDDVPEQETEDQESGAKPEDESSQESEGGESEGGESKQQEPEEGAPEEEGPEAEIAALNDKLLRALAEAENVRRRGQRDKEDAAKYAIANFAREMVSVSDNLKRAMGSVDDETRKYDPAVEQIMVGLEMTEREIQNIFERFGIKTIEALGQKFDHNQHEAMFEVDDASKPAGTVVQEVETGFMLHDRLLRPAKVGVSKGGPKDNNKENGDGEKGAPDSPDALDDAAQKEGQAAYEDKGGEAGAQLDEEL